MADGITFKLKGLPEFRKTLREYSFHTSRATKVICDTKAFYIARRAVAETPMVDKKEIQDFIRRDSGIVAGKIINKRRGGRGEKGLYGKEMGKAVVAMLARRIRGRAFLKSGWLWVVKALEPYAEKIGSKPSLGKGKPRTYGQAKGMAIPAQSGWNVSSKIINTVTAKWDKRNGAEKVAVPALERAFEHERKSMLAYIERKFKEAARKAGIKH